MKLNDVTGRIQPYKVKAVVRTGVYSTILAGAHGIRSSSPVVRRVSPRLADRIDGSNFLQQPTHGRWWQERFYQSMEDPYGFASSDYESRKYHQSLQAIRTTHPAPIDRALEIGAAEGVFTEMLASLAQNTVGLELSETAVARANQRLSAVPGASVEVSRLPATLPSGQFDVIVASDVLYYFPSDVLAELLPRLEDALSPGGVLVVVNYLGNFGARVGGPTVHRICDDVLTSPKVLSERERDCGPDGVSGYQVDVYRRQAA